jgi:hypothetical protein
VHDNKMKSYHSSRARALDRGMGFIRERKGGSAAGRMDFSMLSEGFGFDFRFTAAFLLHIRFSDSLSIGFNSEALKIRARERYDACARRSQLE